MKNIKYLIAPVFFILLFTNCDDKFSQIVDIDIPEHEPALVAYGFSEKNAPKITIDLSSSIGVLENKETAIDQADIKILKNGQPFITSFEDEYIPYLDYYNYPPDTIYKHIFSADSPGFDENASYTLEVESDGFKKITSEVTIPEKVEITSLVFTKDGFVDTDGYRTDELKVEFTDPGDIDNYYMMTLNAILEHSSYTDTIIISANSNDPRIEHSWKKIIPELNSFIYFKDIGYDGKKNTISLSAYFGYDPEYYFKTTIIARLYSIRKDLYNFIKSYNQYSYSYGNPFAEPVVVNTNIENGYGMFSIYQYSEFSIEPE